MSVTSTAQTVKDTTDALLQAANSNPATNQTITDTLDVVNSAAQEAAAIGSGNPVTIATNLFTLIQKAAKLGPEVVDSLHNLFDHIFHKTAKSTNSTAVKQPAGSNQAINASHDASTGPAPAASSNDAGTPATTDVDPITPKQDAGLAPANAPAAVASQSDADKDPTPSTEGASPSA